GLPLHVTYFTNSDSLDDYTTQLIKSLKDIKSKGFQQVGYGDIFLEELKNYRVQYMDKAGLEAVFPLWGQSTNELAKVLIQLGFKAITTAVNAKVLDESFIGRIIDFDFLESLPPNVDPCGENGEFHTFVYDGPIFNHSIPYIKGE